MFALYRPGEEQTQDNVFENLVARGSRICDIVDEGTNNTFTNTTFRTINC